MGKIFMTGYKVKGIKALDQLVELSFYKKSITKPIETQDYNIKGIYGMNGSGKSGIVTSADILRKILINEDYLNNPVVQKTLSEIINKKTEELYIEIEYLGEFSVRSSLFQYCVTLGKSLSGKYTIISEKLASKPATSKKNVFNPLVEVKNGELTFISMEKDDPLPGIFREKTTNLLGNASISSLFIQKIVLPNRYNLIYSDLFSGLISLSLLGFNTFVYMEESDYHTEYCLSSMLRHSEDLENENTSEEIIKKLRDNVLAIDRNRINAFSISGNIVPKAAYDNFKNTIDRLQEFVRIFKPDLVKIESDDTEIGGDSYRCKLIMVYDTYSIDAEFESTGIKKLIKLFTYLQEMVNGGIVFIDELDSNLHDVYLCALLEYLMDYGEGQLCFTTHNVGPMDVLKKHKKSIDFLSEDKKIYPWTTNGNYSPSRLYRSGMIEGSPFNVDATDFIGILDSLGEDGE